MDKQKEKSWHSLQASQVIKELDSSAKGLTDHEAQKRLEKFGANELKKQKKESLLIRFIKQFNNLLIYILLIAAFTTFLMNHLIDSIVILLVVLVNALIGLIQEGKAQKALEAIENLLSPKTTVMRDGKKKKINSTQLVIGDIVHLEAGDKISADMRIIEAKGVRSQESALTGESAPVEKSVDPVSEQQQLAERSSMLYSGTLITSGYAQAIIVATAHHSEIGKISTLVGQVKKMTTPLTDSMNIFAKYLSLAIIFLAALSLLFSTLIRDYSFIEGLMAAVALAVAAIPEGLPAILTITLAIGVQKMASQKAIIRKLPAVETLGSVSTICSDKTGTLTLNQMTVQDIETEFEKQEILHCGILCNDAQLESNHSKSEDSRQALGDPMEVALLLAAQNEKINLDQIISSSPRLEYLPFDSENRYMATVHHQKKENKDDDCCTLYIKGAPEKLMELSHFNPDQIEKWTRKIDHLAAKGQRVLAFGEFSFPSLPDSLKNINAKNLEEYLQANPLRFLGMIGFIDPPRPEAIRAVKECQNAGIAIKMITGDHALTAQAIAKKLSLKNTDRVLSGKDLDQMSEEQLQQCVLEVDVFARTSPEHKLKLVRALQAKGQIVAMTGDGVNDAPALKQADVGIAMGEKGTESAKEASEIVLTDDNFASIARAVKEGRNVFDNLKKAIKFLLPINGGESGSILLAILLGLSLPLTPLQVLWVNMVSSVTLALALSFEPAENSIMSRPPRPSHQALLSGLVIWRIIFVSLLFLTGIFGVYSWSIQNGHSVEYARTHAVNALVVMEVFYLLSVRKDYPFGKHIRDYIGTNAVILAGLTVIGLQMIFNYAPFMNHFFDSRPMAPYEGIMILILGLIVYFLINLEKWIVVQLRANDTKQPLTM